jgi:hypothetical protein
MPKFVVEGLEVVDVAHQQRQRLAAFLCFSDGLAELGVEEFAVCGLTAL